MTETAIFEANKAKLKKNGFIPGNDLTYKNPETGEYLRMDHLFDIDFDELREIYKSREPSFYGSVRRLGFVPNLSTMRIENPKTGESYRLDEFREIYPS